MCKAVGENPVMKQKYLCVVFAAFFFMLSVGIQNAGAQTARKTSALDLYARGKEYQNRGDWYAALEQYQQAVSVNQSYGEAWFALAQCAYELEQYDLAVQYADTAAKYIKNRTDVLNLKGFALIGAEKIDEARKLFSQVLVSFPNDIQARFGLAQLDIFDGKFSAAEQYYADALKRQTGNKKALLSLALLAERQGKRDKAHSYILQALKAHSGNAQVHYFAGYLAAQANNLSDAETYVRTAILLDGNYDTAYKLLADILYAQKRYTETIDICDYRISKNRNQSSAWYVKGLAFEMLGQTENALTAWNTGLTVDPQDEIMRAAFELLVFASTEVENKRRAKWASYHLEKAGVYMEKFMAVQALYEYQRALRLNPVDVTARVALADILRNDGLNESYLSQLNFLHDQDKSNARIDDTIESYTSLLQNSLPVKWDVEPFYLDKTRWTMGLYYPADTLSVHHQHVFPVVAGILGDIFNSEQTVRAITAAQSVSGYAQAFKDARSRSYDFFALIDVLEGERDITVRMDIYSAFTGNKALSLDVYRTGNDRLASVLQKIRDDVRTLMPQKARVIKRRGTTVLIDFGTKDGALMGQSFSVYKKGDLKIADTGIGLKYDEKKALGTVTLSAIGEDISQGDFKQTGFYDLLAIDDELLPLAKSGAAQTQDTQTEETAKSKKSRKKNAQEASPPKVEKRKSLLYDLIQSIR